MSLGRWGAAGYRRSGRLGRGARCLCGLAGRGGARGCGCWRGARLLWRSDHRFLLCRAGCCGRLRLCWRGRRSGPAGDGLVDCAAGLGVGLCHGLDGLLVRGWRRFCHGWICGLGDRRGRCRWRGGRCFSSCGAFCLKRIDAWTFDVQFRVAFEPVKQADGDSHADDQADCDNQPLDEALADFVLLVSLGSRRWAGRTIRTRADGAQCLIAAVRRSCEVGTACSWYGFCTGGDQSC